VRALLGFLEQTARARRDRGAEIAQSTCGAQPAESGLNLSLSSEHDDARRLGALFVSALASIRDKIKDKIGTRMRMSGCVSRCGRIRLPRSCGVRACKAGSCAAAVLAQYMFCQHRSVRASVRPPARPPVCGKGHLSPLLTSRR
jgi:hypothetical protein